MMWIDGISPLRVVEAYVAAIAGFFVYSIPAAIQQHRHSPIVKDALRGLHIDWTSLVIVAAILVTAITANVTANLKFPAVLDVVPVLGIAVWIVIFVTAPLRRPDWEIMPETFKGTIFLLALVTNASFMPVEHLPLASWQTALGLGYLSSVFDNIPLTALALKQGGYDWGFLAYCVGFGGSMIWFGHPLELRFPTCIRKQSRRPLAPRRLAYRRRLRVRLLRDADPSLMESRRSTQEARRSASTKCSNA